MFRAKFPSISSHISQNATRGTQLARCHHPTLTGRFTKNTQSETSEVLRLPRKMTTRISKVLRRSTHLLKTTRTCHKKNNTLWNMLMLKCHKAPRLPRETRLRDVWNLHKRLLLQNSPQAQSYYSHDGRSRTLANGWRPSGHVSTPNPQSKTRTLRCIQEQMQIMLSAGRFRTDRKERNPYCQLARRKNHHYITGTPFKPNKKQFQYSA